MGPIVGHFLGGLGGLWDQTSIFWDSMFGQFLDYDFIDLRLRFGVSFRVFRGYFFAQTSG